MSEIIVKRLDESSETWKPRSEDNPDGRCSSASVAYLVFGAAHRSDAIREVLAVAEETYNGIYLQNVSFDDWQDGVARVTAKYGESSADGGEGEQEDREVEFNVSCSSSTVHSVKAEAQQEVYTRPGLQKMQNPEDVPIGWNGKTGDEFEASGVDVPVGELTLVYSKWMPRHRVLDANWQLRMLGMTRTINERKWKSYDAGQVLFLSYDFSGKASDTRVKVSFNFLVRRNEKNVKYGGETIVQTLYGHDYMWSVYSNNVSNGRLGSRVDRIFVSRVFKPADFSVFGLGV